MSNFWNKLPKPIFALAPMEEVTDVAFREMFARYSKNPHPSPLPKGEGVNGFVMFTEFINVDGLTHPVGFEKLKLDLEYTENQRPIVAQIWGTNPDKFFEAAKLIAKLGFDGIDINMGCPQDKEIGIGACAALIRTPELAGEIIKATIAGARIQAPTTPSRFAGHPSLAGGEAPQEMRSSPPFQGGVPPLGGEVVGLPVSVKTRLGYSKADEMEAWVKHLLSFDIAALSLHARTKQEKSKVPAQWGRIADAVKLRDQMGSQTLIIGNGDVKSREEGLARIAETGCDGVMIGRGAFGHPWIFRTDNYLPSIKERLTVMLEHAELFQEKLGAHKSFFIMRKHFKAYASGFDGAHELRAKLMEAKDLEETNKIVNEFLAGKPLE